MTWAEAAVKITEDLLGYGVVVLILVGFFKIMKYMMDHS